MENQKTNVIIFACTQMELHLEAAQQKMHTNYPVVWLDRIYHRDPKEMRQVILDETEKVPSHIDTILVAMGFCGGSWENVPVKKRVVIPKVDDCITMLLHTNKRSAANLKEAGHFYLVQCEEGNYSLKGMKKKLCEDYGDENGKYVFDVWFESYLSADIIDTGVYDCRSSEYIQQAKENADLIHCPLCYVDGSNIVLEKLVAGQWDQQFIVAEPGRVLANIEFM
ncbi:MAG: DUF1638 domain-containing protein [Lachnospiraceae bacterium]|nr:DUF1638 domain-containing protein [Lachnospiraceae bacterium]